MKKIHTILNWEQHNQRRECITASNSIVKDDSESLWSVGWTCKKYGMSSQSRLKVPGHEPLPCPGRFKNSLGKTLLIYIRVLHNFSVKGQSISKLFTLRTHVVWINYSAIVQSSCRLYISKWAWQWFSKTFKKHGGHWASSAGDSEVCLQPQHMVDVQKGTTGWIRTPTTFSIPFCFCANKGETEEPSCLDGLPGFIAGLAILQIWGPSPRWKIATAGRSKKIPAPP